MTRGRRNAVAVGVSVLAATLAGCGAGAGADKAGGARAPRPDTLTLANALGSPQELQPFVATVARLSRGRIVIRIVSHWRSGQVDAEAGLVRDVRAGRADLGWVGTRAWDGVGVRSFDALQAPLLIDSYAVEARVVPSAVTDAMLPGVRRAGVEPIGVLPGPLRRPLGARGPLRRPADFRDMRFGYQGSQVVARSLAALGARPVAFPLLGRIDGLDAIEQQAGAIVDNGYARRAPYLTTNVVLWPRPLVLFASPRARDRLSPARLALLRRAAREVAPRAVADLVAADREAARTLCGAGARTATASARDLAALRNALAPVYRDLERGPGARAAMASIRRVRAEAGAGPATLPPCPAARATGTGTPLDGLFVMTDTRRDLLRRHIPTEDVVPENWGTWKLALRDGRMAFTQESEDACTWAYGTYSVSGRRIALAVTDGGGEAPNGATAKPGERYVFDWRRYRDTIALRVLKADISPAVLAVEPWRRRDAAPVVAALSRRCPPPAGALGP